MERHKNRMDEKSHAQVSKPIFCHRCKPIHIRLMKKILSFMEKIMNKLKAHRTIVVGHVGQDQCGDKILEQTENMMITRT